MAVPYTFGSATTSIPLSQLDSNFATTITLGNTAIQLGNTVTTLNNMTLGNVTVSSGNVVAGIASGTITQAMLGTNVAGNGPAFSAYASALQSVTSAVDTKVVFDTEQFDTNNNFASNRFTPTVAGYYKFNTTIRLSGTSPSQYIVYWYKNGSSIGIPCFVNTTISSPYISSASTLVYMNGTSDYFEVYANITATSPTFGSTAPNTNYFSGCLVRSA